MSLIFSHVYDAALPSGHVVSGAANATVVDQTGQIVAAAGGARITHDYGTGVSPRLLLEPACIQYVDDPTDATQWSKLGSPAVLTDLGQDGLFRKISYVSGGATWHALRRAFTAPPTAADGDVFALSWIYDPASSAANGRVFVKMTPGSFSISGAFAESPSIGGASTEIVGSITTHQIRADMVLRHCVFRVLTAATLDELRLLPDDATGTQTILFYGANLTSLSHPTSFITGLSRAADVYAPFDLPSSIASAGSLIATVRLPALDQTLISPIITIQDGASPADSAALVYDGAAATFGAHYVRSDAIQTAGLLQPAKSTPTTAAFAFAPNDFAVSFDGAAVLTDNTGDVAELSRAHISSDLPLELYRFRVFDERLPNTILIAPDTSSTEIAPSGGVIAWSAAPQIAAAAPQALAPSDIDILIAAAPQLVATQIQSLGVGAIEILISAAPQIAVSEPVLRSIALSDAQIVWSAAPRLGGDLILPRIYAPAPRLTVTAAHRAQRTLIPRP